ncbi:hypothetical protein DPMN_006875 [Dreissena polymorpha]|uniref:Uncharacterized protein n=1 Tax=Dreissena polymorpha TaxID=45954 RepID=A0A9D4RXV6_DREPO|nr:hypothetical protein DPMN_006875 [Dreissena polymorpha]
MLRDTNKEHRSPAPRLLPPESDLFLTMQEQHRPSDSQSISHTEKDLEDVVSKILKYAPDRKGGVGRRLEKNNNTLIVRGHIGKCSSDKLRENDVIVRVALLVILLW